MWPSLLTCPPPLNGERATATWGRLCSEVNTPLIWASTAGLVTGAVVRNTTWASSPDWDGNFWDRKCWARADSVEPPENLSRKIPWNGNESMVTTTSTPTQPTSTRRRLVKHQLASRPIRVSPGAASGVRIIPRSFSIEHRIRPLIEYERWFTLLG